MDGLYNNVWIFLLAISPDAWLGGVNLKITAYVQGWAQRR